jgi:hypothetical protein
MKMAKAEGWLNKNGSKWQTMPEVMIRYRAASFFGRLNCPDMIMGIYSKEEAIELTDDEYTISEVTKPVDVEKVVAEQANKEELVIDVEPQQTKIDADPGF